MDYLPWGRLAVNQLSEGVLYLNSKTTNGTHKHTEPYTHINKRVLVNGLALKKKRKTVYPQSHVHCLPCIDSLKIKNH